MRPCFKFSMAAADAPEANLAIMDEIGFWGVQAADFRTELNAIKAPKLRVDINSPGGDVFAGVAIHNMLKHSGKEIQVRVLGVAASAASVVAMAGDVIEMPKNTFMMVHNPWGVAIGNAEEMRETADVLDKIGTSILATYQSRTGLPEDELKALLGKDTWLTADEALEKGFATLVVDPIEAKASFDLARADLPENIRSIYLDAGQRQRRKEEVPPTALAKQINDEAVAAGLADHAAFLALSFDTLEAARARIKDAGEIVALCALAKLPDEAGGLIRASKTVAESRTALLAAMGNNDKHIDNTPPQGGSLQQNAAAGAGFKPASADYKARAERVQQRRATLTRKGS